MAENKRKPTDTIEFYIGIVLIFAGIFFLLSKAVVRSSWLTFTVGGVNVSTGLIVIPLMFGVAWLFYNPKSFVAKMITVFGAIAIIGAIILSLRITFTTTSLFDYLIMILLIASGTGMLLRSYKIARADDDEKDDK